MLEFPDENGIRRTADLEACGRDFTDHAHGEARTRERVTVEHVVRDVERCTQFAHLVLEQFGQGLEQATLGLQFEDAVDAVVVGLDAGGLRSACGALDHIGIKRALGKQFNAAGAREKDVDEFVPDAAAFFLRIRDAREAGEEAVRGVDPVNLDAEAPELLHDLVALVAPQQAVVDEDRMHVGAGGMEKHGKHGRVDSARDGADDFASGDFAPRVFDELVLEAVHGEGGLLAGEFEEVAQDFRAVFRVTDFGMELDAEEAFVPSHRDGRAARVDGQDFASCGKVGDAVRMAHPNGALRGKVFQEVVGVSHLHGDRAVFAVAAVGHISTEFAVEQLHAVADTEHRATERLQVLEVDVGRTRFVDPGRTAGKDNGGRAADFVPVTGQIKFAEIAERAQTAHDQLGILRAVIDDGDLRAHDGQVEW